MLGHGRHSWPLRLPQPSLLRSKRRKSHSPNHAKLPIMAQSPCLLRETMRCSVEIPNHIKRRRKRSCPRPFVACRLSLAAKSVITQHKPGPIWDMFSQRPQPRRSNSIESRRLKTTGVPNSSRQVAFRRQPANLRQRISRLRRNVRTVQYSPSRLDRRGRVIFRWPDPGATTLTTALSRSSEI